MKNLVLIGPRCVGKTEVSKVLAQKLNMSIMSLDKEVTKKIGMEIPLIVEKYGWDVFRDIESGLVQNLSELNNIIIDTGGGVVLREENIKNLKKNGILFLLKAEAEMIKMRIRKSNNRPPLTSSKSATGEVEIVLRQREKKYNRAADYTVKTDNLSVEEVADEILKIFKKCLEIHSEKNLG